MVVTGMTIQKILEETQELRSNPKFGKLVIAARVQMVTEAWETSREQLGRWYEDEQDFENTWVSRIRRIVQTNGE